MACDEVGIRQQIGAPYGIGPEAEVGLCHRARFFRIVIEISLGKIVRFGSDDLDRVLVRTDRAVCPEPVEEGAVRLVRKAEMLIHLEARSGHVVVDPDGEVVLRRTFARLSYTAFAMAGVKSLEPRP